MAWKESSLVSERLEFVRLAEMGTVSFAELCRRFGVSRQTGYLWLERFREEGEAGLLDRSRRPRTFPSQTSEALERLVVDLRGKHPRWGGRKISRVLVREGHERVPAPSTVTGILRRHGLLDGEPKPVAYQRFERAAPNELWQMDFKGWFRLGDTTLCHPFGLLDDHSRFNLRLGACGNQQTSTVKDHLTASFMTYGLPERILCDNGSPWGNDTGQPWTPLTVWLLDVGVGVIHTRPFHPQTNGKEERFHLTLDWEVISTRPIWNDLPTVQTAFDQWRHVYNHQRPHDALDLAVPADRYTPSSRPYPTLITPLEYPDGHTIRKVSTTGQISYQNRKHRVGKAFRGHYVEIRPTTTNGLYHVHYRHHQIRTINLTINP